MNYKDLADLIFPNAKEISYYEEKYPQRDLPEGAIVTRFAPSPTGFVHIGGLYQSLIAKIVSSKTNGVFFLRIEDTDQKREVENAVEDIVKSLIEFDLKPDEGQINSNGEIGNYGPYKQSLRKDIYLAYAKHLLQQGKAYPCFCTTEDLSQMRQKQDEAKLQPGYYGVWATCRNLTVEQMIDKIKNGEPYIIRFKSQGNDEKKIKHHDIIKGNVDFPENIQDVVIIKADGLPTYHFAHVIDDHLMKTTHVIRGDEWLSSIPLHLQLFYELGFKAPKYAHIAPIMKDDNGNKRKLSKRKDLEAAVSYYSEIGIPVEAVKEYLLNIANSNFEIWRKSNQDKDLYEFDFDIKKMSVSGALFDFNKLFDIGKNVISKYSAEKVYEESFKWAKKFDCELLELLNNKDYSLKVLGIERGNMKPRKDIAKWSDIKNSISYMFDEKFEKNSNDEYSDKIKKSQISNILNLYVEKYFDINDDKQTWFDKIKDLAEEVGFAREVKLYKLEPEKWPGHVGDISSIIRIGLTGRTNTPDLYEIIQVLGKDRVITRLNSLV